MTHEPHRKRGGMMAYILRLTPLPGSRIPGDRTLYIERFDRNAHAGSGMIYSTNEAHSAQTLRLGALLSVAGVVAGDEVVEVRPHELARLQRKALVCSKVVDPKPLGPR